MESKRIGFDRKRRDISPIVQRGGNNASGFINLVMRTQISVLLMASIFSMTEETRSPAKGKAGRRGLRDLRRADNTK